MVACENCFSDRYMVHIIRSNNITGNCHYCESSSVKIIDINTLSTYFSGFKGYYERLEHSHNYIAHSQDANEVGENLYDLIQNEWYIFSQLIEGDTAEALLNDVMTYLDPEYTADTLFVKADQAFTHESMLDIWEDFRTEIKHGNRFFPTKSYITGNLKSIFKENEYYLPANSILHRGRIDKQPIEKMGAPPKEFASPGRANPRGISYLYASNDIITCVAELRPYKSAIITLVNMTTNRALKLVRLNASTPIISPFQFKGSLLQNIESQLLYNKLVSDFAKPVSPDNSELDYLPTQYLAELIKHEGYDGFLFQSALGPRENFVLFEPTIVTLYPPLEYVKVSEVSYITEGVIFT